MTKICSEVRFCNHSAGCGGCFVELSKSTVNPRFPVLRAIEMTDEEIEQLEQDLFRDLAAEQWNQKLREDIEYDLFGFAEETMMTTVIQGAGQAGEF